MTAQLNGARTPTGTFDREDVNPDAGVNLKVALPSVTLDATVKPDFSQVESDASLVTVNERFALFFAEKRPFFLEGIELFNTPNQLVYTRQIATPVAGAKVTGKLGPISVAYLSALDDTPCPNTTTDGVSTKQNCDQALFNVARLRRDFGGNSTIALTMTDRRAGDTTNTVIASDLRYVFGRMYYFETQFGGSYTKDPALLGTSEAKTSPVWKAELDRTGRLWGYNYLFSGLGDGFHEPLRLRATDRNHHAPWLQSVLLLRQAGSAAREHHDVLRARRGSGSTTTSRLGDAYEGQESISNMFRLRGGWNGSLNVSRNFFTFDSSAYSGLYIAGPGGLQPYVPPESQVTGLWDVSLTVTTPTFRKFNATATVARNEVAIFAEGSTGRELRATAGLTLRPTKSLRSEATLAFSQIDRDFDGSEYARTVIPRLKVEYQPTRALFFRVVSQYQAQRTSGLSTPTGDQVFLQDGSPVTGGDGGTLQTDWLVSYEPTPGTVAFFGYGDTRDTFEQEIRRSSRISGVAAMASS